MNTEQSAPSSTGLRRYSSVWALTAILSAPLVFPPTLLFYLTLIVADSLWAKIVSLSFIGGLVFYVDRETRGRINENVLRVESALQARKGSSEGQEPSALLLRAFNVDVGYADPGAQFSLLELIEPVLRESGYRPIALGENLPLPPEHGVAIIETANETWWEVFTAVARDAAVVIVFPQDTPSLRRELCWLRETGRMAKVALVMPPESLRIPHPVGADGVVTFGSAAADKERAGSWDRVREIWAEALEISLPNYDPRGALLLFLADCGTVCSLPLRTSPEAPRWFAAQMAQDYRGRYGVDFAAVWREGHRRQGWGGPPIADTWHKLNPGPLMIDRRSYLNPPGSNGMQWRELGIIAASGWAATLGFGVIVLISDIL